MQIGELLQEVRRLREPVPLTDSLAAYGKIVEERAFQTVALLPEIEAALSKHAAALDAIDTAVPVIGAFVDAVFGKISMPAAKAAHRKMLEVREKA
jgi:hypothetical protein